MYLWDSDATCTDCEGGVMLASRTNEFWISNSLLRFALMLAVDDARQKSYDCPEVQSKMEMKVAFGMKDCKSGLSCREWALPFAQVL